MAKEFVLWEQNFSAIPGPGRATIVKEFNNRRLEGKISKREDSEIRKIKYG
jgi:hypothetical protein